MSKTKNLMPCILLWLGLAGLTVGGAASAYTFRMPVPGVRAEVSAQPAVIRASCLAIQQATPSAVSGFYNIDPDGTGSTPAFSAYCDMTSDGGGWTRLYSGAVSDATTYLQFLSSSRPENLVAGTRLRFARQMGNWYGAICTLPPGVTQLSGLATQFLRPYGSAITTSISGTSLYQTYSPARTTCMWMATDGSTNESINNPSADTAVLLTVDGSSQAAEVDYPFGIGQSESGGFFNGNGGNAPLEMWIR